MLFLCRSLIQNCVDAQFQKEYKQFSKILDLFQERCSGHDHEIKEV